MGDPSLAGSSDTTAAKLHAYLRPLSFVLILFLPPSSAGHETAAVCPPECEFKYHFHYLTRKMSCNRFHDIKCSSILLYFAHCFTNISTCTLTVLILPFKLVSFLSFIFSSQG